LVPLDFERDDVLTTLGGYGYRSDYRTFFVWEGVTQYLIADAVHATLETLRPAASGSRLVFTYFRRDFLDGVNFYGALQRHAATSASAGQLHNSVILSAWPATRLSPYRTSCRTVHPNRHTDSCRRTKPRCSQASPCT
jgi:O-methyltransferase involved in polyketide biosynthesis